MTRDAVVQLLHRGRHLAASMHASAEEKLAWIGVYPLDLRKPETSAVLRRFGVSLLGYSGPVYRIRAFEVRRALIDNDASICEDDLTNKCDALALGDEDLELKLQALGVAIDRLDLPFKTDYPI